MIRYRLQCAKGHQFEGWFRSGDAYDKQAKRNQIACPDCGSKKVTKALMAPGIASGKDRSVATPAAPTDAASALSGPQEEMRRQVIAAMRDIREKVEANAEYVGPRFAEEARKIHYEESDARGIYGEATLDEAKELDSEGIKILPLPRLPEDGN